MLLDGLVVENDVENSHPRFLCDQFSTETRTGNFAGNLSQAISGFRYFDAFGTVIKALGYVGQQTGNWTSCSSAQKAWPRVGHVSPCFLEERTC